ncbi:histidine phosphatase family protein [Microbulbifer discodermiae]|uniref:histidine phosphatase family protein n=1 Tax=Microbulbifer sp. 2201CG32-9 TaxID=3232309 RepID=UPI00345C1266
MPRILLIRHGEAAKAPGVEDPRLTPLGEQQADTLVQRLAQKRPLALVSSPKARAQQTAMPLSRAWHQPMTIEPRVTEIPSPRELPLAQRGRWIRELLQRQWDQLEDHQLGWRREIMDYLVRLQADAAVVCHFMVINSVVAAIRRDSKILQFRPDYTSVTELQLQEGSLTLVQCGEARTSQIL